MKFVYSPEHSRHHPKTYIKAGSFHEPQEVPGRAEALHAGLTEAGHEFVEARDFGPGPRAAIHTPEYLYFLETIAERWSAEAAVIAAASRRRLPGTSPRPKATAPGSAALP